MRHESSTAYLNRYRTRSNPTKSVCVWISVDLSLKLENLMIYESHYWKDELQAIAKKLRRRRAQRRWSESSFANLEKEVMVGFYSVRKLYEASKLEVDPIIRTTGGPALDSGRRSFSTPGAIDFPGCLIT
jgi:hypothetical protein